MAGVEPIRIEVAYARADRQRLIQLTVAPSASVDQVIRQSGILVEFPEIDLKCNPVGIFGRRAGLDRTLRDGDRVEIYRPLKTDPKSSRRRRARHDRS